MMTNIVLQFGGAIPTNTVAFQEYALSVLLASASFLAERWSLDTAKPITTDQMTHFSAVPTTNGIRSGMQLENRYAISINDGKVATFADLHFWNRSFVDNDEQAEALLKMTNVLTLKSAVALARGKLKQIGIDEKQHGLGKPVKTAQWRYDWDGVLHPLPLYEVQWHSKQGAVHMQISGVTSNVASFFQNTRAPSLRIPMPTNYLEMIGLPTNVVFLPWNHEALQEIEAARQREAEEKAARRPQPVRLKPKEVRPQAPH